MKKLLLVVPFGLLAATGLVWYGGQGESGEKAPLAITSKNPTELFKMSEHSLRQIVRYGDEKSLTSLEGSLESLESVLGQYKQQGVSVSKAEDLISRYHADAAKVSEAAPAYLKQLKMTDAIEEKHEEAFVRSLNQIGLYELKSTFEKLERARLNYLKDPMPSTQKEYAEVSSKMKEIISELYLDSEIEQPLFAYLDNHKRYFQTVVALYTEAGVERIGRLRSSGYAIKTELQLLPVL